MARVKDSQDSLFEATRERAAFSGHGNAMGAAGYTPRPENVNPEDFLTAPGDFAIVNPQEHGFEDIRIGMNWHNVNARGEMRGRMEKLLTTLGGRGAGIDLDLGCLYELHSGDRGTVQAFGERFGAFDTPPYIALSGDDRTGDAPGEDEYLVVNGRKWPDIKRILLYAYIYRGVSDWSGVRPHIHVLVPGEPTLSVVPAAHSGKLAVCAVASLENIRDGIKMTNHTEYFAGHAEMDRAFGYGLPWEDGHKS